MVPRIASTLLLFLISATPVVVFAGDDLVESTDPIALQQRLQALEDEVRALRMDREKQSAGNVLNGNYSSPETAGPAQSIHLAAFPPNPPPSYGTVQPIPEPIKYPLIRVTGFFQADTGWIRQDDLNRFTVGDLQDGSDFRRARLAATGDVAENLSYMVEMDFGFPGRPSFMDVWMDLQDVPWLGNIRIGYWRQPFSLDAMNSVRELTFLERALPFAFVPFRQIGIGTYNHADNERATWALSLFRFPTDMWGSNVGDNGGYSMSGRTTFLAVYADHGRQLVHFGLDYAYLEPSNDLVQYRNQPEFFVGETGGAALPGGVPTVLPPFVNTGPSPAASSQLVGVEAAAVHGPLHVQSELMYALVNQIAGPSVALPGMYVQAGWLLTGETRPYNRINGTFGRIVPERNFLTGEAGWVDGWGAWELAARWSYIDLMDENIRGGRLNDLTFGVNWYWNRFAKVQLNYIRAFLDDPAFGDSNAEILALRAQVDF